MRDQGCFVESEIKFGDASGSGQWEFISRRLGGLATSCENAAWLSDVDRAFVRQVEREKDRLALRLSEAERIGNWDRIKEHFTGEWNKFIMDFEQSELRVEVEHPENAKT